MLKKNGRLIFLAVLLLVVTELTIYVNNYIDSKTSQNEHSQIVQKLREALNNSTTDISDKNPYLDLWIQELDYFKSEYPKAETDEFKDINIEDWNTSIDDLKNEISSVYISDTDMLIKVKELVKEYVGINYVQDVLDIDNGYFRSILLLMEDDATKQ